MPYYSAEYSDSTRHIPTRVLHILANFELTLAWVKSVCEIGQLKLVYNFSDFYLRLEVLHLD